MLSAEILSSMLSVKGFSFMNFQFVRNNVLDYHEFYLGYEGLSAHLVFNTKVPGSWPLKMN